jgi:DNA-binding SARP family transcriptional activator
MLVCKNGHEGMGSSLVRQAPDDAINGAVQPLGKASVCETEELRIHLLGGFRLSIGARVVRESEWYLRKPKNTLKILALAPNHHLHRGQLIDLLWPDLEPEAAANNLYKTVHVARRVLEPNLRPNTPSSYLHRKWEALILDPPGPMWIDVDAFRTASTKARLTQDPADYEYAIGLYAGDLLPEDWYDEWAMRPREQLKSAQLRLLLDLAQVREERGEITEAIDVLEQIVAIDAAHEEAHATLMRLLAYSGQRQLALRKYQQLREALRSELDAEPDLGIQQLYRKIVGSTTSAPPVQSAPVEIMPTKRSHTASQLFVGRELELERCQAILDRFFAGMGGCVFVTGSAGIGKSRLAAEVSDRAGYQEAITLWGAAYKRNKPLPYGPFRVALEGFAVRMAPDVLRALLGDSASELANLAPTIAITLEVDLVPGPIPSPDAGPKIFLALADFFTHLSDHAPVVVVLEDLQAAHKTDLLLLEHLTRAARYHPVLFICTVRTEEVDSANGFDMVREKLNRDRLAESVHLEALQSEAAEILVTQLLGGTVDPTVHEIIYHLARGNPYFIEESVRALRGRNRIREVDGDWRLRDGAVIRWNPRELRQPYSAQGDYRLARHVRGIPEDFARASARRRGL